ncbi:hypothetical protein VT84_01980 [Gemmata sp. SH-PL17]|uniref:hypothetical protein n=1 Tax=Gemmata sp. SH-PL17 TaxID=1630693 RepID=UPI00078B97CD|nr:hypothetical protein [Gemmata sp. SH-PL17]AMV23150.1 hypothetical protein VT84_01980 [Gemmata sp. SH-PL17]
MIRVNRPPITQHLTAPNRTQLGLKHTETNGFTQSDARIEPVWNNFRRTNAGRAVLVALQTVFRFKCAFCERVNAKAVDHFYPKERYPKRMFKWNNFLLCCAECNQAKGSFFPVRKDQRLLDPTHEEPLDYFTWDFRTGAMVEVTNAARARRASTTRERLKLDEGPLRDERRVQFNRVLKLLADVCNEHPNIRLETRQRLEEELHPNRPYLGIIRFLFRKPNIYRPIVDDARAKLPDIDTWIAAWPRPQQ